MKKLSELFEQAKQTDIDMPETWGQGRATLGGLVGGVLFEHLHHVVGTDKQPRSLTVSFVGPVQSGAKAELTAEIFRQGKSVTQAQSRLVQDGQVMATMLGSFGVARESNIACTSPIVTQPPSMKSLDDAMKFPYIAGMMPEFIQHIDMRQAGGNLPFSGSSVPDFCGYMRFEDAWQDDDFSLAHLITLADTWPPSVLPMLKQPAPASSLTWTIEFLKDLTDETMQSFWTYDVKTDFAADGYAHVRENIWNDKGELVIISRQTVTVFG